MRWRAGPLSGDLSKWDVADATGMGNMRWRAGAMTEHVVCVGSVSVYVVCSTANAKTPPAMPHHNPTSPEHT